MNRIIAFIGSILFLSFIVALLDHFIFHCYGSFLTSWFAFAVLIAIVELVIYLVKKLFMRK